MATASSSTIELTFAADSGGVRATGTVSDYSATMSSTMMGNTEMGGDGLTGDLEFVIGPLGNVEMISTPEITGAALPVPISFQFNAVELFPRFPGHPLEPGDTWAGSCPKRSWRLRWLPVDSCYAATSFPSTGGVPSSSRCVLSIQRSL